MRVQFVVWDAHDPRIQQIMSVLHGLGLKDFAPHAPLESFDINIIDASASIVIVHAANHSHRSTRIAEMIKQNARLRVVTVGPIDDSRFILDSLHHGADFYVDQDDISNELPRVIRRLLPDIPKQELGQLITVIGSCGGCGTSTIAVNLAVTMAKKWSECGLVDLHKHGGDCASLLDLKPTFSLQDVSNNEDRLDRALLSKMLTKHHSGVRLLASPRFAFDSHSSSAAAIFSAIELCQTLLPATVIDLQNTEDALHREVILRSDRIYITTRLSFNALRHARNLVEMIDHLRVPRDKINLIANGAGQPNDLLTEDVEQATGIAVTKAIRFDPETVNAANNVGIPVVLKSPETCVAKDIIHIVNPTEAPKSGLMLRMKHWFKNHAPQRDAVIKQQNNTIALSPRLAFE